MGIVMNKSYICPWTPMVSNEILHFMASEFLRLVHSLLSCLDIQVNVLCNIVLKQREYAYLAEIFLQYFNVLATEDTFLYDISSSSNSTVTRIPFSVSSISVTTPSRVFSRSQLL